jgi:hypothetical protein
MPSFSLCGNFTQAQMHRYTHTHTWTYTHTLTKHFFTCLPQQNAIQPTHTPYTYIYIMHAHTHTHHTLYTHICTRLTQHTHTMHTHKHTPCTHTYIPHTHITRHTPCTCTNTPHTMHTYHSHKHTPHTMHTHTHHITLFYKESIAEKFLVTIAPSCITLHRTCRGRVEKNKFSGLLLFWLYLFTVGVYTCHRACVEVNRQLLGAIGSKDSTQVARHGSEYLTLATSVDGEGLSSQRKFFLCSGKPQVQFMGVGVTWNRPYAPTTGTEDTEAESTPPSTGLLAKPLKKLIWPCGFMQSVPVLHTQAHVHLEPQKVTLFGSKIFAAVPVRRTY